jgi:hypothetical protein
VLHIKKSTYKLLLLLIAGFILMLKPESFSAAANKDVILVLDTSLSMVGIRGKTFLNQSRGVLIHIFQRFRMATG